MNCVWVTAEVEGSGFLESETPVNIENVKLGIFHYFGAIPGRLMGLYEEQSRTPVTRRAA